MSNASRFRFNSIKEQVLSDWETVQSTEHWKDMPTFNYFEKKNNEKYLRCAADQLIHILEKADFRTNLDKTSAVLTEFFGAVIEQCPFLSQDEKTYLNSKDQLEATRQFIQQAMEEDGQLSLESLGQAIRNFWITALLQTAYGKKVTFTQPLYGYSMLYPYTDNVLDSQTSAPGSKTSFCKKLTLHLLNIADVNEMSQTEDPYQRVWDQVQKIYDTYPPAQYKNVQNSLLAIHEAQIESLKQQNDSMLPYEVDLLGKSFYKGGTSVLADAFLVDPELSHEGQVFAYTYGAVLQLCDDLQDMESDKMAKHFTIFSQLKDHYVLDALLNKVNGFLDHSLHLLEMLKLSSDYNIQLIISKNTRLLLAYAVLQHDYAFSKSYVRQIYQYLPVRPKALKKSIHRVKKAFKTNDEIRQRLAEKACSVSDIPKIAIKDLMEKDLTNVS